jgi:hypothetical protein
VLDAPHGAQVQVWLPYALPRQELVVLRAAALASRHHDVQPSVQVPGPVPASVPSWAQAPADSPQPVALDGFVPWSDLAPGVRARQALPLDLVVLLARADLSQDDLVRHGLSRHDLAARLAPPVQPVAARALDSRPRAVVPQPVRRDVHDSQPRTMPGLALLRPYAESAPLSADESVHA